MKNKTHKAGLALVAALSVTALSIGSALAASGSDVEALKAQIEDLKSQIAQLKQGNTTMDGDATPEQRIASLELKVDNLVTAAEEGGLAGLAVTGYMDLGYFYNRNQKTSSFTFGSPSDSTYAADNSSMGDIYLDITKTFGAGPTAPSVDIVLAPNRGYGAGTTGNNNIIHTAQANIPITDKTIFFFGQVGSFQGYEVYQSNLMPTITHNLLYDFSLPSFFTGAGVSTESGNSSWKFMLGNEQNHFRNDATKSPSFTYRLDYTLSGKTNLGSSGYIGEQTSPNYQGNGRPKTLAYYNEFDLTYTFGSDSANAQVDFGQHEGAALNGGDARWYGFSLLGNHKFSAKWGLTLRLDYLNDSQNGGGSPNLVLDGNVDDNGDPLENYGSDGLNGFGIAPECFNDPNKKMSSCKGANRSEFTFAMVYSPSEQLQIKGELRYDKASEHVFVKDDQYVDNNFLLGFQAVYIF